VALRAFAKSFVSFLAFLLPVLVKIGLRSDKMTSAQFWRMIANARQESMGSWEKEYTLLSSDLAKQTSTDWFHYTVFFQKARGRAFTPGVLCAAALWYRGYFSFDSFLDFTDCLVASSQEVLNSVIAEPDFLISYPELSEAPQMQFGHIGYEICRAEHCDADALRERVEAELTLPKIIRYAGSEGLAIVTPENAKRLTPVLFERYGAIAFS
jgi:Protein of unknown function (DUF4240)